MAVKIHVSNFQSLKDAHLEVEGFTAVTGPNNTGKSAMLRAVRGVFQNTPGTSFIRHGETECSVALEFEDGRSLEWKKGTGKRSKPTYIIDQGPPLHPGRGVPEEVRAFGVVPIRVMENEVWPTLAEQFTGQVFLLDQPGTSLAEAVADVERVARLNSSLRDASKDLRSAQGSLKVRREDEAALVKELALFEGFDVVDTLVVEIEAAHKQASRYATAIHNITDLRDREVAARSRVRQLEGIEEIHVSGDQQTRDLRASLEGRDLLVQLKKRQMQARGQVDALEGVENVSVPTSTSAVAALDDLKSLTILQNQHRGARRQFEALRGVEGVVMANFNVQLAEKTYLAIDILKSLRGRREEALGLVAGLERDLGGFISEARRVEEEVEAILVKFPVCPTCGTETGGPHCQPSSSSSS